MYLIRRGLISSVDMMYNYLILWAVICEALAFLATNLFANFLIACDTFSPQAKELLLIGLMRGIVCQNELVFAHLMNYIFGSNFELNVWTIHLVPCSNLSHRHTRHTLSVPCSDWITISIDLHHFEITGLKAKCIVQWYLALKYDRMSFRIVWVDRLGSGSSLVTESCSHETYHFFRRQL